MHLPPKRSLVCIPLLVAVLCLRHFAHVTRPPLFSKGITIPTIFLSTSSCHSSDMKSHESSDQQPQIVSNYPYAYVRSPFHMESLQNQSQFHCSWLVEAAPNRTLRTVLQFEIATSIRLDLYDGPNEESPKIGSHSGKMDRLEWQTNSSHLYIRYSGSGRLVHSSSFKLYVEQSDPLVWCAKGAIQCRHGQKCVDLALQCDSVDDCGDGTDEQDCPNENVTFSKECGLTSEHLDGDASPLRIVGGVASLPASWPWMVSIRQILLEPEGHHCGGSIINRKWILTAAHCMQELSDITAWTVNAGKYQKVVRDSSEVVRYIKRIMVHEDFIGEGKVAADIASTLTWYDRNVNDIALLELNAPLPEDHDAIGPICLAGHTFSVEENDMSYVIGWGSVQKPEDIEDTNILRETVVPVISNQRCHTWMPEFNIGPRMLCAGFEQGGHDACTGDSGGPLFVLNSHRFVQIGIVSVGTDSSCGGKKEAGIYTRVTSFVDWIGNVTQASLEEDTAFVRSSSSRMVPFLSLK